MKAARTGLDWSELSGFHSERDSALMAWADTREKNEFARLCKKLVFQKWYQRLREDADRWAEFLRKMRVWQRTYRQTNRNKINAQARASGRARYRKSPIISVCFECCSRWCQLNRRCAKGLQFCSMSCRRAALGVVSSGSNWPDGPTGVKGPHSKKRLSDAQARTLSVIKGGAYRSAYEVVCALGGKRGRGHNRGFVRGVYKQIAALKLYGLIAESDGRLAATPLAEKYDGESVFWVPPPGTGTVLYPGGSRRQLVSHEKTQSDAAASTMETLFALGQTERSVRHFSAKTRDSARVSRGSTAALSTPTEACGAP